MSRLLTSERKTYETAWALDAYKSFAPGEAYVKFFKDMATPKHGSTVLDAGCGSGKGAIALDAAGYLVQMADLTPSGLVDEAKHLPFAEVSLWHPLDVQLPAALRLGGCYDWVYCCDVLEHIPPPFTMLVVANLLEVSRNGVFLSISTSKDDFGNWVGHSLHQSLQSFTQWRDQLKELGNLSECRDLLHTGIYLLRKR